MCTLRAKCAVAVSFRGRHRSRRPTLRDIPPGTVSNGVCYLHALMAEDWPRCRHRRSCPCPVGTTPGTLHARAIRSSGSAVEYSHKVTLSERSQAELGVLTWVLIRVLTLVALSEYSHGFSLLCALRWGYSENSNRGFHSTHIGVL